MIKDTKLISSLTGHTKHSITIVFYSFNLRSFKRLDSALIGMAKHRFNATANIISGTKNDQNKPRKEPW